MADNIIRRGIEAEPLLNRAFETYSHARNYSPDTQQQELADKTCSSVDQINDLTFVVIRNSQRNALAVYRVTSQGDLKPLKRWPAELE